MKMIMGLLIDIALRNAKTKRKRYTLNDGDNLRVVINPSGRKNFLFGKDKNRSIPSC